ncbi:hypothetical protein Ddye_005410 [Dipteronia dyeriana]|uniref:Uncharacterized protein n=1 Tax=Dipteronia dyeriana TaxID=168575 RepID=A0AAD9XGK1_9ROSI|nr:hypothetical protein Ddye_005410 [Dipteronia dyeriana]
MRRTFCLQLGFDGIKWMETNVCEGTGNAATSCNKARSKTERFFMKDWTLGLFLEVGLSQFVDLGSVETVVVAANGGFWLQNEMEAKFRWFLMGLGFGVE